MGRLSHRQFEGLLDFLRECYACRDRDAFVAYLLRTLPQLIPSEITSYNQVDPSSRSLTTMMVPASACFPGYQELFAAHMADHLLIAHYQQTRDGRAHKLSDFLTQREFHRLGLYQEFYRRLGVEDQMVAVLATQPPRVIALALNRSHRDFSERERLLFDLLRPHLAQAYANAQAVSTMQQGLEASGQGVVVLSREGQVRLISPRADGWLAAYCGQSAREGSALPEPLRSVIRHEDTLLRSPDVVPPPLVPLQLQREGKRLVVRHLCEAEQCLLLLEERQTAPQPASLEPFGLTQREAEVLRWVAQGKTNAEIGCILGVSVETVKKHLQHIYEKLGVETRTAAATLALSWRSGGVDGS